MATFTVSTKADKDSPAIETKLTIDFEGCSEEILREIATSAIVVKWQSNARRNGIPASATIKAVEYRPGTRLIQSVSVEQLVTKFTSEEKAALIAKLQASLENAE